MGTLELQEGAQGAGAEAPGVPGAAAANPRVFLWGKRGFSHFPLLRARSYGSFVGEGLAFGRRSR